MRKAFEPRRRQGKQGLEHFSTVVVRRSAAAFGDLLRNGFHRRPFGTPLGIEDLYPTGEDASRLIDRYVRRAALLREAPNATLRRIDEYLASEVKPRPSHLISKSRAAGWQQFVPGHYQTYTRPADHARLFLYAEAPAGFRMQNDRFQPGASLVLYVVDIFKP